MLLIVLAMIFVVVALTRPAPNRPFRGRYPRHPREKNHADGRRDATLGMRDPTRPL